MLTQSDTPALREAEFLLAIPEHEVPLPGGIRPSQNDLWVLARGAGERDLQVQEAADTEDHYRAPVIVHGCIGGQGQVGRQRRGRLDRRDTFLNEL